MNIDLTVLKNNLSNKIDIDINYSFNEEELKSTEIRKLDNVNINGCIKKDVLNNEVLDVIVEGVMILPCARTLKDVKYPFSLKINGEINDLMEETTGNLKNFENSIDIFQIIWENILMEIPMRVVSEDAEDFKTEGNGWKLITDENEGRNINPELQKLKDLL